MTVQAAYSYASQDDGLLKRLILTVFTMSRELLEQLRQKFATQFSDNATICAQHGHDESWHAAHAPLAVVYVRSTEDVQQLMHLCRQANMPLVAYGAGTSLEGHIIPIGDAVCVDFSQMNRVLAVNREDLDCRVQPGICREQLNEYLRETGLFFTVDPGANASIGGMVATRASGTNAVRYGTMRENVLSLQAVLADGRVIETAQRARKSAAGYDLTHLLVGSEGTLALITEISLRLYGIPEQIAAARSHFPSIEAAVNCVIEVIQLGIPIARIELLDEASLAAINAYSKLELALQPTLFMEFHGTPAAVREQSQQVGEIAAAFGGDAFIWSADLQQRNEIWRARHSAYYAVANSRANSRVWTTDVCVPISQLAACIAETKRDLQNSELLAPIFGHVGDGNYHVLFVVDPHNPREIREASRLNERMIERALRCGGTCTGEHGIGAGKLAMLRRELGDAVDVMQSVKRALDPDNLLNPGKTVWA